MYFGCDGVQDSGKTVDACGICGGNNSTCTDCDGVVKPNVVNNATCGNYQVLLLIFFEIVRNCQIPARVLAVQENPSITVQLCIFPKS